MMRGSLALPLAGLIGLVASGCGIDACHNSVVSPQLSGMGFPLHYDMSLGCIATTHLLPPPFPGDPDKRDVARAALDAWAQVSGKPVCFSSLAEQSDAPSDPNDRRIHFELGVPAVNGFTATTTNYPDAGTGVIRRSIITISSDATFPSARELTRLVGIALGLDGLPAGSDTIMDSTSSATSPTANDGDALRKLYTPSCQGVVIL